MHNTSLLKMNRVSRLQNDSRPERQPCGVANRWHVQQVSSFLTLVLIGLITPLSPQLFGEPSGATNTTKASPATHWAFQPLSKSKPSFGKHPSVDSFVEQRLKK